MADQLQIDNCGDVGIIMEAYDAVVVASLRLAQLLEQGTRHGVDRNILKLAARAQVVIAKAGVEIADAIDAADDPGHHLTCPLPTAKAVISASDLRATQRLLEAATAATLFGGLFDGYGHG